MHGVWLVIVVVRLSEVRRPLAAPAIDDTATKTSLLLPHCSFSMTDRHASFVCEG